MSGKGNKILILIQINRKRIYIRDLAKKGKKTELIEFVEIVDYRAIFKRNEREKPTSNGR